MLHVADGRGKEALAGFLKASLTERAAVEVVVMDTTRRMNAVREHTRR
ncbi:MAG: hypothetical protein R3B09_08760 [Nannocystaceae bacterium]